MQKIRIDFDNPGLPQHISAVENDSQSRFFQATLYENGKAYTAPEGATYSIMYRGFGPQNQGWYDTINDGAGKRAACAVSGNVVTCEIARQALQVPGHVSIVLCVTTGKGYMIKSWPIECDCKNDRYDSTVEIQSFFYVTQISNESWTQAIQAVEELKNTIDPTLSVSGKAADAAKVGEAVNAEAERAKGVESQIKEDLDGVFEKTYSRNLLKYNNLKQGFYLNDKGEVTANSLMAFIEDYLSVDENTYYTLSRYNKENKVYIAGANCIVCFYNSEKDFLSYKQIIDENSGKFITPLNCKYIRLSGLTAWFSDELLQLEKGTIPTDYVEHKMNMTLSEEAVPDSVENKTVVNHLIVKKNGTGDFIKIQDAINSINDSSKNNRYIIHVYEGEYNLGEDFAESDISNPSFSGIFVPDFVTIKGEGNRDNIILFVELTEHNEMISALNLSNTSALEGITVRGTRTRYCIHDDFAKNNNISYERSVKNCKFIAIDTFYNSCYASGCKEGADWKFENCIFDASKCNDSNGKIAFLNHNNINWQYTSSIKFINCKFIGKYVANENGTITLRTLNTNANNMETNVSLYGCDIGEGIVLKEESKDVYGSGILFKINGFANKNIEYSIVNTDGKDYSGNINLVN